MQARQLFACKMQIYKILIKFYFSCMLINIWNELDAVGRLCFYADNVIQCGGYASCTCVEQVVASLE